MFCNWIGWAKRYYRGRVIGVHVLLWFTVRPACKKPYDRSLKRQERPMILIKIHEESRYKPQFFTVITELCFVLLFWCCTENELKMIDRVSILSILSVTSKKNLSLKLCKQSRIPFGWKLSHLAKFTSNIHRDINPNLKSLKLYVSGNGVVLFNSSTCINSWGS